MTKIEPNSPGIQPDSLIKETSTTDFVKTLKTLPTSDTISSAKEMDQPAKPSQMVDIAVATFSSSSPHKESLRSEIESALGALSSFINPNNAEKRLGIAAKTLGWGAAIADAVTSFTYEEGTDIKEAFIKHLDEKNLLSSDPTKTDVMIVSLTGDISILLTHAERQEFIRSGYLVGEDPIEEIIKLFEQEDNQYQNNINQQATLSNENDLKDEKRRLQASQNADKEALKEDLKEGDAIRKAASEQTKATQEEG